MQPANEAEPHSVPSAAWGTAELGLRVSGPPGARAGESDYGYDADCWSVNLLDARAFGKGSFDE
jgi:hypothetical protein